MKKIGWSIFFLFVLTQVYAADDIRVSKKMDISVFQSVALTEAPDGWLKMFDDMIVSQLERLKRFTIIGYQYRFSADNVPEFLRRVRDAKKQSVLHDETLIDPQFGTVMIPADEMKRIVNSVFVVLPQIESLKTTIQVLTNTNIVEKKTNQTISTQYTTTLTIEVRVMDSKGLILTAYRDSKSVVGYNKDSTPNGFLVLATLIGFEHFIRTQEDFKLRSVIFNRDFDSIYMQLGDDLGVLPGYEFIKRVETPYGYETRAMIRVREVYPNFSIGQIVLGDPQISDPLIESAKMGFRIVPHIGALMAQSKMKTMDFTLGKTWSKTFNSLPFTLDIGLRAEPELGFDGIMHLGVGVLLNDPVGVYVDLGAGMEYYWRMFSFSWNLSLSIAGWSFDSASDIYSVSAKASTFTFSGNYVGIKPEVSGSIQFSQDFKLRVFGQLNLYPISVNTIYCKPSDTNVKPFNLDRSSYSYSLAINGVNNNNLTGLFDLNAFEVGAEFVVRF